MNTEERKNEIIKSMVNVEYHPEFKENDETLKEYTKIPFNEIAMFGGMAASFLPMFRTVTQDFSIGCEGLYRMSFPEGVVGELAKFKDGSGYLGTIMNNGFAGQARWNPVENLQGVSTAVMAVDPLMLVMAGVIASVDKKMDAIQETNKEILDFLEIDKESQLKANVQVLTDVMNNFKYNWDNEKYKSSRYNQVIGIEKEAKKDINFYRTNVMKLMTKVKSSHSGHDIEMKAKKIQAGLKNYQLALYISSFAKYLSVLLLENFERDYLNSIVAELQEMSYQYRLFYSECYETIETASQGSIGKYVLVGLAGASHLAGKTIEKIPVIRKGPVDEALIAAGNKLSDVKEDVVSKPTNQIMERKQEVVSEFIDSINKVNRLYNKPMIVQFSDENLYLKSV